MGFHTLNILLSSCLHDEKSTVILSVINVFLPVAAFKILYLSFDGLNKDMGTLSFLGSVVNFGKFLAIIISDVFSASFFSSSDIPVMCVCVILSEIALHSFWILFISFFFLFAFKFAECLLTCVPAHCCFLWLCESLMRPSEGVPYSFCSAVVLSISLILSHCFHHPPILACCLFPLEPLTY